MAGRKIGQATKPPATCVPPVKGRINGGNGVNYFQEEVNGKGSADAVAREGKAEGER